ncbi:12069_t:CDS:2, partial [Entrophospora sp. SA101]
MATFEKIENELKKASKKHAWPVDDDYINIEKPTPPSLDYTGDGIGAYKKHNGENCTAKIETSSLT